MESRGLGSNADVRSGSMSYRWKLDDLNAYFEFIPYDKVLKNATSRNEAIFRELKVERLSKAVCED